MLLKVGLERIWLEIEKVEDWGIFRGAQGIYIPSEARDPGTAQTVPRTATRWQYETSALRVNRDASEVSASGSNSSFRTGWDQAESTHVLNISSNSSPPETWISQGERFLEVQL